MDSSRAAYWLRKAAEQGFVKAQLSLGLMYAKGVGVAEDDHESLKWYLKAADQGDADAQLILGVMHFKGEGVIKDDVKAYAWIHIAVTNGIGGGGPIKTIIAKKMTSNQVSKALELAKEMIALNPKLLKKE